MISCSREIRRLNRRQAIGDVLQVKLLLNDTNFHRCKFIDPARFHGNELDGFLVNFAEVKCRLRDHNTARVGEPLWVSRCMLCKFNYIHYRVSLHCNDTVDDNPLFVIPAAN